MKKVCKIRCYPNETQKRKIYQIFGSIRYIHNLYLASNIEAYKDGNGFLSAYDFNKYLTKLKKEPDHLWLKEISTKAIKDELLTTERSFKKFFKKKQRFPRFHSKKHPNHSFFFIRDHIHLNTGKKNIIKIPILGAIRITERNYLPEESSITSGRLLLDHDKFYLIFIYDTNQKPREVKCEGMGIDLGIKTYATICMNGDEYLEIPSFLKSKKIKESNEKITYYQRIISKKAEMNYGRLLHEYMDKYHGEEPSEHTKNIMKGESYNTSEIRKIRKKITKIFQKRSNYIRNKIYQSVNILVKAKPEYITIEDLNIKHLLEDQGSKDLHKFISLSNWYLFISHLTNKCREYQIELRKADKFYASTKTCSNCGYKFNSFDLRVRTFRCPECGYENDRDKNAARNLLLTKKYSLAI